MEGEKVFKLVAIGILASLIENVDGLNCYVCHDEWYTGCHILPSNWGTLEVCPNSKSCVKHSKSMVPNVYAYYDLHERYCGEEGETEPEPGCEVTDGEMRCICLENGCNSAPASKVSRGVWLLIPLAGYLLSK